jgi:hypothetical protein
MEETQEQISPLEARRQEVAQYEQNIAMYTAIYTTLPHEWPEHLEPLRTTKDRHAGADKLENLDDVELLSKLWYSDDVHKAIRSEKVELTKAKAILDFMEAQENA